MPTQKKVCVLLWICRFVDLPFRARRPLQEYFVSAVLCKGEYLLLVVGGNSVGASHIQSTCKKAPCVFVSGDFTPPTAKHEFLKILQ